MRNPSWVLMFVLSRFFFIRKIVASFYRSKTLKILYENNSIFSNLDTNHVVNCLETEGYFQGLQLPQCYVDKIFDFARTNICYADGDLKHGFHYDHNLMIDGRFKHGIMRGVYIDVLSNCPTIQEISQDFKILEIANKYTKVNALLMNARLWWNFIVDENACDIRKGARAFHYDPDDYCCLSFGFYITNVDLQSGPHICVKGSHKQKKLRRLLSLDLNCTDAEIIKDYGRENIITISGKSGYGFVEDKSIFHKADSPKSKERLVLFLQYGINNY